MQEFMLTDKETKLLVNLLREKQTDMKPKIRRAGNNSTKENRRPALRTVNRLIERFEELGEPING